MEVANRAEVHEKFAAAIAWLASCENPHEDIRRTAREIIDRLYYLSRVSIGRAKPPEIAELKSGEELGSRRDGDDLDRAIGSRGKKPKARSVESAPDLQAASGEAHGGVNHRDGRATSVPHKVRMTNVGTPHPLGDFASGQLLQSDK